jgi:hypothetical protein
MTMSELYLASSGGPLFVAIFGEDEARRRPESVAERRKMSKEERETVREEEVGGRCVAHIC